MSNNAIVSTNNSSQINITRKVLSVEKGSKGPYSEPSRDYLALDGGFLIKSVSIYETSEHQDNKITLSEKIKIRDGYQMEFSVEAS